jgi:hypothetical protein
MDIESIKQDIERNRLLKGIILASLALALIFYFMAFFTRGAEFDDTFLKKEVMSSDAHYMGKNMYGSIHITVKGIKDVHRSAEVEFRLPNNINSRYTVNFKDPKNWDAGIENIKDGDGNIVFEGEYRKDRDFMVDKNGEFWLDYNARVITYGESPYNWKYSFSVENPQPSDTYLALQKIS